MRLTPYQVLWEITNLVWSAFMSWPNSFFLHLPLSLAFKFFFPPPLTLSIVPLLASRPSCLMLLTTFSPILTPLCIFFSFPSSISHLFFAARLSGMVCVSSDRVVVLFFLRSGGPFTISEPEVVWWGCLDSSMWAKVLVSTAEKQEQLVEKVPLRNAFYMCQCIH